jgi:hypothetical protein
MLVAGKENTGGKAVFIAQTVGLMAQIETLLGSYGRPDHCAIENGRNIFQSGGKALLFEVPGFFGMLEKNKIDPAQTTFILPADLTPRFASRLERMQYGSRWRELLKTTLRLLAGDGEKDRVHLDLDMKAAAEARRAA